MRFVFASYVSSPGYNDPETWLQNTHYYKGVLAELAKTDTVFSIEQINHEGDYDKDGVNYFFRMYSKRERLFPTSQHRLIKHLNPDIVVIHGLHFPVQIIQLRRALGKQVRIIVQNHAEKPFTGWRKYLQKIALKRVDACLFASTDMGMRWVQQGHIHSAQKIHQVMEVSSVFGTVNREAAQSRTGVNGEPAFVWVGRLNANKDPLTVVSAFLDFARQHPTARLYMIYQTNDLLPEVTQLLNQHPETKHSVILVGRIEHADLLYWYNSVDFYISGSHYEGSGVAICEAMSCGCIPIATNIDAFRMITDNGASGLLYQPGNQAQLISVLNLTQHKTLPVNRSQVLAYYATTLSFGAIAGRFREVASSLS